MQIQKMNETFVSPLFFFGHVEIGLVSSTFSRFGIYAQVKEIVENLS